MNERIWAALATDRTIDITTIGRNSGRPSRIEIWFHNVDGRIFITGLPGRRDWYANLAADPTVTFHLKESVTADLSATARLVLEPVERRTVFEEVLPRLGQQERFDAWMARSPLVEIQFGKGTIV